MEKKIIWSPRTSPKVEDILRYIEKETGYDSAVSFREELDEIIKLIVDYPFVGQQSGKFKTVRSIPVGKYHRLYYRSYSTKIEIVDIFDLRQKPSKNRYK